VFSHVLIGLLNFVTETQQQGNIIHTTATLSQARYSLAAASSDELEEEEEYSELQKCCPL
jgi:hypothetical protein